MKNSVSEMEKHFQTQSTFKRNSRYYDAPGIQKSQKINSLKRRRPLSNLEQSHKLDKSFTCSTATLTDQVQLETLKFKSRLTNIDNEAQLSDYQKQHSSPSSPKIRTFNIEKVTSRDHHHKRENKIVEDQRMFSNFKLQKANLNKTCDFSKTRGKSLEFTLKHMNDLYHESKKGHQICFMHDSTLKTKVNYSLENKHQKRYFFRSKRKEDIASTVQNPQKIDQGLKIASNFKGSNLREDKISPFFIHSGRELPSHFDNRHMNELTNFYKDKQDKIIMPNIDYTIRKMREDLLTQRKDQIKKSKKPTFLRNEICEERYFKMKLSSS